MILGIFIVSMMLIAGGLLGLYGAINLIPTDLGLAYFHAGTLSLVAGLVTMALGFAARANVAALRRMAPPAPVPAPLAPPPVWQEPGETLHAPVPASQGPALAGIAAAGAAGAANLATTARAETGHAVVAPDAPPVQQAEPEPVVEPLVEPIVMPEPVIDLPPVDVPPVDLPPVDLPPVDLPPVDLPEPVDNTAFVEAVPEPAPTPAGNPAADRTPVEESADIFALPPLPMPPLPDLPSLRLDPIPSPPRFSIEDEIRAELGRQAEPEPAPEKTPEPASPSGLIEDADFAALASSTPPLAPIDTLEVVGSYDSGGTRFTMYSDGSVVASGPEGETRYPTLQDLRRHLDQIAG